MRTLSLANADGAAFSVSQRKHSKDRIQHLVEPFADVVYQEPQNEITTFLKQRILATVAPIGVGICEVLTAIEFDDQSSF